MEKVFKMCIVWMWELFMGRCYVSLWMIVGEEVKE